MGALFLAPAAEDDILAAAQWYETCAPGLGIEFLDAVNNCLLAVAEQPGRFPAVRRDVRRALVRRFPYGVLFVVRGDAVRVIACMHARRHPRTWRPRAE